MPPKRQTNDKRREEAPASSSQPKGGSSDSDDDVVEPAQRQGGTAPATALLVHQSSSRTRPSKKKEKVNSDDGYNVADSDPESAPSDNDNENGSPAKTKKQKEAEKKKAEKEKKKAEKEKAKADKEKAKANKKKPKRERVTVMDGVKPITKPRNGVFLPLPVVDNRSAVVKGPVDLVHKWTASGCPHAKFNADMALLLDPHAGYRLQTLEDAMAQLSLGRAHWWFYHDVPTPGSKNGEELGRKIQATVAFAADVGRNILLSCRVVDPEPGGKEHGVFRCDLRKDQVGFSLDGLHRERGTFQYLSERSHALEKFIKRAHGFEHDENFTGLPPVAKDQRAVFFDRCRKEFSAATDHYFGDLLNDMILEGDWARYLHSHVPGTEPDEFGITVRKCLPCRSRLRKTALPQPDNETEQQRKEREEKLEAEGAGERREEEEQRMLFNKLVVRLQLFGEHVFRCFCCSVGLMNQVEPDVLLMSLWKFLIWLRSTVFSIQCTNGDKLRRPIMLGYKHHDTYFYQVDDPHHKGKLAAMDTKDDWGVFTQRKCAVERFLAWNHRLRVQPFLDAVDMLLPPYNDRRHEPPVDDDPMAEDHTPPPRRKRASQNQARRSREPPVDDDPMAADQQLATKQGDSMMFALSASASVASPSRGRKRARISSSSSEQEEEEEEKESLSDEDLMLNDDYPSMNSEMISRADNDLDFNLPINNNNENDPPIEQKPERIVEVVPEGREEPMEEEEEDEDVQIEMRSGPILWSSVRIKQEVANIEVKPGNIPVEQEPEDLVENAISAQSEEETKPNVRDLLIALRGPLADIRSTSIDDLLMNIEQKIRESENKRYVPKKVNVPFNACLYVLTENAVLECPPGQDSTSLRDVLFGLRAGTSFIRHSSMVSFHQELNDLIKELNTQDKRVTVVIVARAVAAALITMAP